MRVEVHGDDVAVKRLGVYADHISDFRPLWDEVGEAFTRREELWFARQGEGWAPLDPDYAARKARIYPGMPILVARGDLRRSLTDEGEAVIYSTPKDMLLGSTSKIARFHARGTRHMPARPPLIPVQRFAAAVGRLLVEHVHYPKGRR